MIDELLKELQGAQYFTRLHLRSGYLQIWMCVAYIGNFDTHLVQFEFLVMSFGLTNAFLHFKLMNDVFGPYLLKFIMMFFFMISLSIIEHGLNSIVISIEVDMWFGCISII